MQHVIVLGAGASKADGAPLQFDLLREYFLLEKENSHTPINTELRAFFLGFYGIDVATVNENTDFPTFEEVLGMLELALSRSENFRIPQQGGEPDPWDQHRIQQCREYVVTLICTILARKLGEGSGGGGEWHNKLIQGIGRDGNVAFLSLNYDLLVDNAIANQGRTLDYGTAFSNPIPTSESPVGLYKLHGSLNWLRCPICGALTHTKLDKGASYPKEKRAHCQTSGCGADTVPIVIPPTFFKVMSDFHLQQIWHLAERQLVAADCIYFCGYSLPDADLHIRYLLKRAEVNRGATPEVYVASNHPDKSDDDNTRERQRYKRLFREPEKVHYTQWKFEDFAKDPFGIVTAGEWKPAAKKGAEAAG